MRELKGELLCRGCHQQITLKVDRGNLTTSCSALLPGIAQQPTIREQRLSVMDIFLSDNA